MEVGGANGFYHTFKGELGTLSQESLPVSLPLRTSHVNLGFASTFSPSKYAIWINPSCILSAPNRSYLREVCDIQRARRHQDHTADRPRYSPHKRARLRAFFPVVFTNDTFPGLLKHCRLFGVCTVPYYDIRLSDFFPLLLFVRFEACD